ncbi:MAG: RNA polymerase sigma factor, partial [Firmicutes bacterium]|nr:RNA polymerase sigma factor [Bacillota bacterium]
MEDTKIIELFFSRDESALLQTSAKYGAYCSSIAFNVLGNSEDASECMNDTLLRAWNSIPPQKPESLKAYLGRIARNLAIDRYDKLNAEKRGGGQYELALEELAECIADTNDQADSSELSQIINDFLKKLDADKRIIFVKRYFYLDPVKQIAKDLSMSESNVKTTL